MTPLAAQQRLQSILRSLTHTGDAAEVVFNSLSVIIASERDREKGKQPSVSPPRAFIYQDAADPYLHYGDTLQLCRFSIVIEIEGMDHHGNFALEEKTRDSGAQQGAALTTILSKVIPATYFIDTTSGAAHTTWIQYVDGSGRIDTNRPVATATIEYEALCETA
jgi:hypothetical protein